MNLRSLGLVFGILLVNILPMLRCLPAFFRVPMTALCGLLIYVLASKPGSVDTVSLIIGFLFAFLITFSCYLFSWPF